MPSIEDFSPDQAAVVTALIRAQEAHEKRTAGGRVDGRTVSTRLEAAIAELAAAIREEIRQEVVVTETRPPDRLLTVEEAADALAVGRTTVYGEVAAGRLRSIKVGRRRLIPSSALGEYIDSAAQ